MWYELFLLTEIGSQEMHNNKFKNKNLWKFVILYFFLRYLFCCLCLGEHFFRKYQIHIYFREFSWMHIRPLIIRFEPVSTGVWQVPWRERATVSPRPEVLPVLRKSRRLHPHPGLPPPKRGGTVSKIAAARGGMNARRNAKWSKRSMFCGDRNKGDFGVVGDGPRRPRRSRS